jgi:hypothetical protein
MGTLRSSHASAQRAIRGSSLDAAARRPMRSDETVVVRARAGRQPPAAGRDLRGRGADAPLGPNHSSGTRPRRGAAGRCPDHPHVLAYAGRVDRGGCHADADGPGSDYPLEPGNRVFVPRSELDDWNLAIGQILPGLQLIGGVPTPFTLIESLQNHWNPTNPSHRIARRSV